MIKEQSPMNNQDINKVYCSFRNALLSGNRNESSRIVKSLVLEEVGVFIIYEKLFKRAMYEIGELWECNEISVATEHLASSIVEALINELYSVLTNQPKVDKTVVISNVENELHTIGLRMVNDLFEMNGWNTLFLGANTPNHKLIRFVKSNRPDLLAISQSIYFNLPMLEDLLQKVHEELPEMPVLIGGQAFRYGGKEVLEKYPNVSFQPDLDHTARFISKFR